MNKALKIEGDCIMLDLNTVIETGIVPKSSDLDPTLPNIKRLFRPDSGFILFDADLEQADAQIVAWESDDDILKEIFRDPDLDLHTENAKMIFGSCPYKSHPNRKKAKAGCHAVNYGVGAKTLAKTLGITVKEAEDFIKRWFEIHPGIKAWHNRTEHSMRSRGYIENVFGNRKYFFGDVTKPTALSEALAWVPQSTVGLVINRAWEILDKYPENELNVLLQVHDSLVGQVHHSRFASYLPKIRDAMLRPIPYNDPLTIGSSIEISPKSWGDIRGISWDGYWLDKDDNVTDEKCPFV
jgi:DNA polymerase-1